MSKTTKVLFLGATGYIGGSVLDSLLSRPNASKFDITVYVRSAEKAKKFEKFGLKTLTGDYSALEQTTSESGIVYNINIASADDFPMTEAILAGARKRYDKIQSPLILIHTSGSAIVGDDALGKFATEKIYDDADGEYLNSIPAERWHRQADVAIANAHKEGFIKGYLVTPALVYELATSRFVEAKIQASIPTTVSIPAKVALARGKLGMVGPQLNLWSTVALSDPESSHMSVISQRLFLIPGAAGEVVDFFDLILNVALEGKKAPDDDNRYYFVASGGDVIAKDFLERTAQALHDLGALPSPETSEFTQEELENMPLITFFGTNSRITSSRSRSIGWNPVHTLDEFLDGIRGYIQVFLEQERAARISAA